MITEALEFLKSIPLAAWTALGTALIAFFGVWLTNWNNRQSLKVQLKHSEKLRRQELSRDRLEELYSQVNEWGHAMSIYYTGANEVMKGKLKPEQHRERIINLTSKYEYARIEMIIGIYGEALQDTYRDALMKRKVLSSMDDKYLANPVSVEKDFMFGFVEGDAKADALMSVMDSINSKYSRGTIKLASEGVHKAWSMKRELKSPNFASWEELPVVRC